METHSFEYGKTKIEFDLFFKERKSLRISVTPELSVFVVAPIEKPIEDIIAKVRKRAAWIIKQQNYFKQFKPLTKPKEYFSGETHLYLGRHYRLKIHESNLKEVKLKGKFFEVFVPDKSVSAQIKDLMLQWYRNHATIKYNLIIDKMIDRLKKYGIPKPDMTVRKMKSRWGSCQADKNRISLNIELIKAPLHCIEYVILHELVHLKHPFHDKKFYNFLALMMPDWELRKKRLEMVKIDM